MPPHSPPILLITTTANRQTIAACCERSIAAGVMPGMTLANARALLTAPEVIVQEMDVARNHERLRALAVWALRFTPLVAPDPPDGLLLDVSGCARLHRGERRLVNAIANSIEWLGFRVRVACAATFGCAWAVARFSTDDRSVIEAGDERAAIRSLPVEALRIDKDARDALQEVNITHIGDMLELPRCEMPARFGADLLLRLDQALGTGLTMGEETIEPVRPLEPPRVERAFDGPVKQIEAIELAVRELTEELCALLLRRESGARRLDLEIERIDAAALRETIALSRPSREGKHLWTLLQQRVERINLGYGVERIALTATRVGRLSHEQIDQWRHEASAKADERLNQAAGELIDTLASRLGAARIAAVQPVESHLPERAFRMRPALHSGKGRGAVARIARGDRPTRLFERAEPIEVNGSFRIEAASAPARLRWRDEEHAVTSAFGPERIADEWWRRARPDRPLSTRDYFKVQTDRGRCLWLYHELETGRWFAHGEWA